MTPIQKWSGLAIVSFVLGLMTLIFPIISFLYLIAAKGGPGYLQSLFCGSPVALASIAIGTVSLAQTRGKGRKGRWMAVWGILAAVLFCMISCIMVLILILPFLFYAAH
jgi:hypothetical protein